MHRYQMISTIGEGAYGVVQKCRNKQTNEIVAIKKFKESDDDKMIKKTTTRQIHLLKLCKSQNIIALKEAYKHKKIVCLVFEYLQYNLLQVLEKTPQGIDPTRIQSFMYQLLKGLAYMHSLDAIHRDIKPQNLLVNQKNQLKICDFGFARQLKNNKQQLTDYVSTRWYRPPQLLVGASYGKQIDLWAVGCIMAQLIDGNPLFPGDNQIDQLYKIQKCLGSLTPQHFRKFSNNQRFRGIQFPKINNLQTLDLRYFGKIQPKGLKFMKQLLKMTPSQRLTAIDALKHPYFDNIRQDDFLIKLTTNKTEKIDIRKTSASTAASKPQRFSKSNRQTQYVIPFIKNIKSIKTNINQKQIEELSIKETQQIKLNCQSTQLRQANQFRLKQPHKSMTTSHGPKRSSIDTQKTISKLSFTQDRFGLSCSKLSINKIYGSKRQATKFNTSQKVMEQDQQNI